MKVQFTKVEKRSERTEKRQGWT